MAIEPWKELRRSEVFKKYSRAIERVDFLLPSGIEGDFYIKAERAAASVLALTEDNKVLLLRQFRPGPMEIFNEIPGGYIDDGEQPEDAARRELLEETGYVAETITYLGKASDGAYSSMKRHCFVATGCVQKKDLRLDDVEFGELIVISLEDFREQLRSGKLSDAETGYRGLDYLGLL